MVLGGGPRRWSYEVVQQGGPTHIRDATNTRVTIIFSPDLHFCYSASCCCIAIFILSTQ